MASGANTVNTGPKRVDQNMYKELAQQQEAKAQQQIQSQANTFGTSLVPSAKSQEASSGQQHPSINGDGSTNTKPNMPAKKKGGDGGAPNWRLGKFHNDNDEDNYLNEQGQIE